MRHILAAALCALLAGCTTPFSTPVTDDGTIRQPDNSLRKAENFNGIRQLASHGSTRVVWVHGMCTHDAEWAKNRQATLVAAVGATNSRETTTGGAGEARTIAYQADVGPNVLETNYVLWSPLTAQFKEGLRYDRPESDDGGRFPYKRARLSGQLKTGLMNDCLIDAVAYSGANGQSIRSFMRAEVCKALGGIAGSGSCRITGEAPPAATVFVAESLGSKILFDAVRSIYLENRQRGTMANLDAQLSSVQLVFLLANQLPILDAADQPPLGVAADEPALAAVARSSRASRSEKTDSSLVDFLGVLNDAGPRRARRTLDPVQVVAFTDPNDLLSYRLDPALLNMENVKVANVIVSNAPTLFGFVSRPDHAHCGYKWNPHVIGTIANGYDGTAVPRTAITLEKACGLAEAPVTPPS